MDCGGKAQRDTAIAPAKAAHKPASPASPAATAPYFLISAVPCSLPITTMLPPQSTQGQAHCPKTLRVIQPSRERASVLECGGPPPLFPCAPITETLCLPSSSYRRLQRLAVCLDPSVRTSAAHGRGEPECVSYSMAPAKPPANIAPATEIRSTSPREEAGMRILLMKKVHTLLPEPEWRFRGRLKSQNGSMFMRVCGA